jgi:hypothetical protein
LHHFREGDTSCEDRNRSRRALAIGGGILSKLLSKSPFASAKEIASHFYISVSTVKDILARELGPRKFTRRSVPHFLSERQKNERVSQSRLLLDLLERQHRADFNAIATGDESGFRYVYPARIMYARSRSDVTSCVLSGICTSIVMITFFTGTRLLVLKALPKGRKFNQDDFLKDVISLLSRKQRSNRPKKHEFDFVIHMDNSMCYNTRKISLELEHNKIE